MQQHQQQMGYFDHWEEERLNLRHRSSSITGMSNDWANHPSYPRPGGGGGYPPPNSGATRRPPVPMANSSSAWDLSPQQFPQMTPNRGMTMQQVHFKTNSFFLFSKFIF